MNEFMRLIELKNYINRVRAEKDVQFAMIKKYNSEKKDKKAKEFKELIKSHNENSIKLSKHIVMIADVMFLYNDKTNEYIRRPEYIKSMSNFKLTSNEIDMATNTMRTWKNLMKKEDYKELYEYMENN
ncbi:hypothetical protein AB2T90_11305 [Clostridium butyricum]|uniref:hypothetical protein n=1 Tax=Clostridium butyricum TaxID=1492 RepID=UPI003465AA63